MLMQYLAVTLTARGRESHNLGLLPCFFVLPKARSRFAPKLNITVDVSTVTVPSVLQGVWDLSLDVFC